MTRLQKHVSSPWRYMCSCEDPGGKSAYRPPVERAWSSCPSVVSHSSWDTCSGEELVSCFLCRCVWLCFCFVVYSGVFHPTQPWPRCFMDECLLGIFFCDWQAKCISMHIEVKECVFLSVKAVHWEFQWIRPHSRAHGGRCDAKQAGQVDTVV